jgi:hypothetical protein
VANGLEKDVTRDGRRIPPGISERLRACELVVRSGILSPLAEVSQDERPIILVIEDGQAVPIELEDGTWRPERLDDG